MTDTPPPADHPAAPTLIVASETDIAAALSRVEAAFGPGTLADKCVELARLQDSGDTILFEGAVDWSIFLIDHDRHVSGYAPSLDDAFADMRAGLAAFVAEGLADKEPVICGVALADDSTDEEAP